jgi:hypothetical protein
VVERGPEKAGVGGSIPSLATTFQTTEWQPFSVNVPIAHASADVCHLFFVLSLLLFSRHPDLPRCVPDRQKGSPAIV